MSIDSIMNWVSKHPVLATVLAILCLAAFSVCNWVVSSYFEAATYSRLTGTQVSTWDALWVDLRVVEPNRGN